MHAHCRSTVYYSTLNACAGYILAPMSRIYNVKNFDWWNFFANLAGMQDTESNPNALIIIGWHCVFDYQWHCHEFENQSIHSKTGHRSPGESTNLTKMAKRDSRLVSEPRLHFPSSMFTFLSDFSCDCKPDHYTDMILHTKGGFETEFKQVGRRIP